MNFYSQVPELHHLTCRSLWDLTWVTFVYIWISPCSTSLTLTVRSVPTGCTGRVFRALRGKRSVPQATSPHRITRWRSLSALAFPAAEWSLLFCHTRTTHDWFDLSFIYWGFITHESVESAALRVLTDLCDHNPTVVALSLFGLFPAVSPHDPAWLDRMDHLR
jgi:hypothetical protein